MNWLEEHRDALSKLRPEHPHAARVIAYLSQWVDAGFSDVGFIKELLSRFSKADRSRLPIEDFAHLLLSEAMVEMTLGQEAEVFRSLDLIVSVSQETSIDPRILALAQFWKARCLARQGDFQHAIFWAEKSRELALQLGYGRLSAVVKIFEGNIYLEQDNLSQVVELLEQARAELAGIEDDWASQGDISYAHGLIAGHEGRYYQAIEHYSDAINCYHKRGVPPRNLARALEKIAIVKRQLTQRLARTIDARLTRSRGDVRQADTRGSNHSHSVRRCEKLRSEALAQLAEAETICRSARDDRALGSVHIARCFLLLDKGELDETLAEANQAFGIGLAAKDYVLLGRSRVIHSKIESAKYEDGIDEGYDPTLHAQQAHDYAQDALGFAKRTGSRHLMAAANIRVGLTMCNEYFNDPDGASEYCKAAAEYLSKSRRDHIGEEYHRLKTYILRGKIADAEARDWVKSMASNKTLRELKDEFDQMIILQVWAREDHKISRVAKTLAISPKKVRRVLERSGGRAE